MNTMKKVLIGLGGLVLAGGAAIGAKALVGKKNDECDEEACCAVEETVEEETEA